MNLLIVEDEPATRTGLIKLCERAPDMHVVGEAVTGAKAIEAAESLRPDLMLLDADLPDMSGFDVLRALRRRHKRRTILISANVEDASGAVAAGTLDFLVKPVNEALFCASILRARARGTARQAAVRPVGTTAAIAASCDLSMGRPLILVGEREHRLYPLDPQQIAFVQAAGNYVTYHLPGVEYIARESIKHLDTLLSPAGFVRIQRSLLLNLRAISYAEPIGDGSFVFTLNTGARLHSGLTYRDAILEALPLRRRVPTLLPAAR